MAPFEMESAFGSGQSVDFVCEDLYSLPLNSSVSTPVTSVDVTGSGSHDLLSNYATAQLINPAGFYNERHEICYNFGDEVAPKYGGTLESLQSYLDYCPPVASRSLDHLVDRTVTSNGPDRGRTSCNRDVLAEMFSDGQYIDHLAPWMEIVQDNSHLRPLSTSPFDSVQASYNSTLTSSGPSMATSRESEQGGESAENLNNSLEDITSWPAPAFLFPAIKDHSFASAAASDLQGRQTQQTLMSKGESNKTRNRKRKRSEPDSKKFPCEIRISKKISKQGKHLMKEKAWLGTFATLAEKERALDVGNYFLCTKRNKTFSDPNSKAILSPFNDHVQALPIAAFVETVIKMAKHYGENGFLPERLDSL